MDRIWRSFDTLLNALAFLAAATIPLMFVAIVYDVTTRTFGGWRISWVVAITEYTLLYTTTLGAPWLLREKGHVSMEAFRTVMPETVSRWLEKLVLLICFVGCAVVTIAAVPVLEQNIGVTDIRANFLKRWVLYLPVVLCFGLCAVQFLRFLLTRESMYKGVTAEQESL